MQGAQLLLGHLAALEQMADVADHARALRLVAKETAGVELTNDARRSSDGEIEANGSS